MNERHVHLLLVEDDEDDYVLIRDILSEIPNWLFQLDWAHTFDLGLEWAATGRYDLCFLDYRLGERNGIELLEKMQAMGSRIPVLMLTGQGDHFIDLEAMERGAADYLEKSALSASMVERSIRYALDRARTLEALRTGERRQKELSRRLIRTQEEERRRIAKELHDSVGGNLTAVKYALEDRFRRKKHTNEPSQGIPMKQIIDAVQETIEEIQNISSNLRPSILDSMGILRALEWTGRKVQELYEGLEVKVDCRVSEEQVPEELKIVLLRVAQESFTNAAKHSGGDEVRLSLFESEGMLKMLIRDNGRGFDLEEISAGDQENLSGGMGFESMRERVELSGGTLAILSVPYKGARIEATWPPYAMP
ncbi:MAG: response regulator [Thermodesulfobacteriota bacterium]